MDAEELVNWLRAHGYQGTKECPLTRNTLSRALKPEHRQFWEAVIQASRAAEQADVDLQEIEAAAGAQRPPEDTAQVLRDQLDRNAQLQGKVAMLQERNTVRTSEVLVAESQLAQLQQQLDNLELQQLVLSCYHDRGAALLPMLDQHVSSMQHLAAIARTRATSSATSISGHPSNSLDNLCNNIQGALSEHADLWLAAQQEDEWTSTGQPPQQQSQRLASQRPIIAVPSSTAADNVLALNALTPNVLLTLLTKVLQQCIDRVRILCGASVSDTNRISDQALGSACSNDPVTHPAALLQQRQQAHLSKFIHTEALLSEASEVQAELAAAMAAAQPLLEWPYNKNKLMEACLSAEISVVRSEMGRLREELSACQAAEAALEELVRANEAGAARERQLNNLVGRLMAERRDIVARWTAEARDHEVWAHQHLPAACSALSSCSTDCQNLMVKECEAAGSLQLSTLPWRMAQLPDQASQQHHHLTKPSASGNPAQGGGLKDHGTVHHQAEGSSTLQLLSQSLPGVARTGKVQLGFSASGSTGDTPGTAAAGKGSIGKVQQGAVAAQLTSVLRSACVLDALAPLRCPAALLNSLQGHQARLRSLALWLFTAQPWLDDTRQRARETEQRHAAAQAAVEAARHKDQEVRVALEHWQDRASKMMEYVNTHVKQHLEDYRTMPAVNLLPDVQYSGLNAAEYLAAIRELYQAIDAAEKQRGQASAGAYGWAGA